MSVSLLLPWVDKFFGERKGNEVFTIICWNIELVKLRGLDILRANIFFYGFFEGRLGFITYSVRIYNREVNNRDFTVFRYMGDFI